MRYQVQRNKEKKLARLMLSFTHVVVGNLLHRPFFLKCSDKSHRMKQIKGKSDLKVTDGSFLPCKRARLYFETSG